MKELHIYLSKTPNDKVIKQTFCETEKAILAGENEVHTVQTHFCNNWMIYKNGYTVFIHMSTGKIIKIDKSGTDATTKEIRQAHNLERMLLAGSFGDL